jgi:Domain of unknown function (DUF4440)
VVTRTVFIEVAPYHRTESVNMAIANDRVPAPIDLPRRALLLAAAAGSLIGSSSSARQGSSGHTAEAASNAMDRAIVARDRNVLDRLISPDFVWVRGSGVRADKAAFIAGLAATGVTIEPFTPQEGRWLKSGSIAVFSAINELRGTEDGIAFTDRHSFCDVWQHDMAAWRLVYTQITRAPQPA